MSEERSLDRDRVVGALIGTFVGDALGMPVEGWSWTQIRRHMALLARKSLRKGARSLPVSSGEVGGLLRLPSVANLGGRGPLADGVWFTGQPST